MGKRKGGKRHGGGGVTKAPHQNKNQKNIPKSHKLGGGGANHLWALELDSGEFDGVPLRLPRRNTENGEEFDADNFSVDEVVHAVLAKALIEYIAGGGELDQDSFTLFFEENYMAEMIVKCARHSFANEVYNGADTSSEDDDDTDFRFFSNRDEPAPFYANQQSQRKRKGGRNKKRFSKGIVEKQEIYERIIAGLLVGRIVDEQERQERRNKQFRWMLIIGLLAVAFCVYYWWF